MSRWALYATAIFAILSIFGGKLSLFVNIGNQYFSLFIRAFRTSLFGESADVFESEPELEPPRNHRLKLQM